MDTTYVNRENTNEKVFEKATQQIRAEGNKRKHVTSFVESYKLQKRKRACKIIRNPNTPIFKVSFKNGKLQKRIHHNRRVGRPRMNWTEETIIDIWDTLRKDNDRYKYTAFDDNNQEMIDKLYEYANTM